ncbi:MAG: murein L,D-transpeptidase YcbB/YkuD, partial [Paracoccaceae bacterium]
AKKLKPGQSSKKVVEMRKRLTALGYKKLGTSPEYNEILQRSVQLFQVDHGLNADGVAGSATIKAMNVSAQTRLQQVIVGLERQRWLNKPRGKRHVFVNQADFRAYVMDNGKATFETRVVVGKAGKFRTPEFTDEMTHLIINPTWHVPQSIARNEYLPMLKKDPTSLTRQGLRMTNAKGQRVDPAKLDYSLYNSKNFPFDIKQPPSTRNALGLVKFMFPNRFNIYLHDTPSKSLFARDARAYSHGCVRVQKPFELAYTLLKRQSSNPKGLFHDLLDSGRESQVDLDQAIPVHLVYHSAWITPQGRPNYRADIYGRDKKIFKALQKAGVVMRAVRS